MVAVASCGSRVEAELKRAALESDGLRAVVATDDAGGLHPQLAASTCAGARLMVPTGDADRARRLLAELDAGTHALDDGDHDRFDATTTSAAWWIAGVVVAFAALRLFTVLW
jgi:hypothetical protein